METRWTTTKTTNTYTRTFDRSATQAQRTKAAHTMTKIRQKVPKYTVFFAEFRVHIRHTTPANFTKEENGVIMS